MSDPLTTLREAGLPVDQLSLAQQEVLAALTGPELAVLASVHRQLAEADEDEDAEVMAHEMKLL
jgi:hypothetical protein